MSHVPDRVLAEFEIPSEPGNERAAMDQVVKAVTALGLEPLRLERLRTAVGEATMNAIEHGNHNRPEFEVAVQVRLSGDRLSVRITDHGGGLVPSHVEAPHLAAKLAGQEPTRGWGLYLIERLVDEFHTTTDATQHTIELVMLLNGVTDADERL